MTNRRESFLVDKIDRDAAWSAERGRVNADAEACVCGFMSAFTGPEERAVAADALARALAPIITQLAGSARATNRFAAMSGRAEVLPAVQFRGRRP